MYIENLLLVGGLKNMSMNKKILILFVLMLSMFICNKNVYADTTSSSLVECTTIDNKNSCNAQGKCRWINGACYSEYVALEPCNENRVRNVLKILGYVLVIVKVVVPLIIIGYGTFDIFKAVIDKDDKSLPKQAKRLMMRVIIGMLIFFIPNMVHAAFKLSDRLDFINQSEYLTCASCILDPFDDTTCYTTDVFE